jgi:hypothetical protein
MLALSVILIVMVVYLCAIAGIFFQFLTTNKDGKRMK